MQEHLHNTAALLDRIAETADAQEREKLMKEYQQSMRTSMKIHHLMHQVAGSGGTEMQKAGGGMMMKGKKKMCSMGCCSMMSKKGAGATAEASSDKQGAGEDHSAHGGVGEGDTPDADDEATAGGAHEGH